ncbi:MAG TPA: phytoene desaturase family protein [Tenuifilaceae bacterium]|nr:phytoene desaturase family protein [Tenuifilaceae bacterium]
MKKAAVIGAGVGGLAIAIRLAVKGYRVTVFEKYKQVGGKLNQLEMNGFRFDTGPSLFTLPSLVDELFTLAGDVGAGLLPYKKLENVTRYFFPDGKILNTWSDPNRFAQEAESVLNEPAENILHYLKECEELYRLTANTFIYSPFPTWKGFTSPESRELGKNLKKLRAFETMHQVNAKSFSQKNTIQLFNRFATYNGSNPYKAPGTLTIIPHLEHNVGAFFPERGMYSIAQAMESYAKKLGVRFELSCGVQKIEFRNGSAAGIVANGISEPFDLIVNDTDIFTAYPELMPERKLSWFYKRQQPSSSALIFYWGIKGEFPQIDIHNILFSNSYPEEFKILSAKSISSDPTVYIFISSKMVKTDAPAGHENWFVMVNAPEDCGQDWETLTAETRKNIISKISKELKIDVEPLIVCEDILTPPLIEKRTGSFKGALYGISSNNKFAAFSRHPNRSRRYKNLYFTGGSVHPGGGIPLCLASAKIVDNFIQPI